MMEKADRLQADSDGSIEIVKRLRELMIEYTLPLWSGAGWDSVRGGFVERLNFDGEPDLEAPRRTRVQARQIYSYATAARLKWFDQDGTIALDGLEYLLAKARRPDGGYAH